MHWARVVRAEIGYFLLLLAKTRRQTSLIRSVSFADLALLIGVAAILLPTMFEIARFNWTTEQVGHGPIVMAIGLCLLLR